MKSREEVDKLIREILTVLEEKKEEGPMGATSISKELDKKGFEIGERAVRYHLKHLDEKGFTKKKGKRKGRVITEDGKEELKTELVGERVGFLHGRIKELVYEMSFDLTNHEGTIIANLSYIDKDKIDQALKIMSDVFDGGWAPSSKILVEDEKILSYEVPEDKIGVATVCNITIDGILENNDIPVSPKFGGVLEVDEDGPVRFTDAISYEGTSIDPLEVFASKRMTSYHDLKEKGRGLILANVREIPVPARTHALDVVDNAKAVGLNAVLKIGKSGGPLFGLPIGVNRVGVVIAGGINPVVAVEEEGIDVETEAMQDLVKFSDLAEIEKFI